MSNAFGVVLIVGIITFVTGIGGRYSIPIMGVGAAGLVIAAFAPREQQSRRKARSDYDQP